VEGVLIEATVQALGGPPPRGNRFTAWERSSTDFNRSISRDGLNFFDHVAGRGGDAVTLVEWVEGVSTGEALTWLETNGLKTPSRRMTRAEKHRAEAATGERKQHAADLEDFRKALAASLDVAKLEAGEADDLDRLERAASLQFRLTEDPSSVYKFMLNTEPARVADLVAWGRADRQHAAEVTALIVGWLGGAA